MTLYDMTNKLTHVLFDSFQRALVEKLLVDQGLLDKITIVSTVDGVQGAEFGVVIVCTTRTTVTNDKGPVFIE